jgi:acetyltransferase-like isoleucine patch superfamily enzyme
MGLLTILRKIRRLARPENVSNDAGLNGNSISEKAVIFPNTTISNTKIGDYSYIANNSIVYNSKIGKFTSIGPNVIIAAGEHPTNFISTSPICYQSTTSFDIRPEEDKFYGLDEVIIGNDVWIGAACYIKNGVTIGDGAIIGVGSVVLKDVEPYSIVIGTPAKLHRYRFEKNQIDELLKIKWWNWDSAIIKSKLDSLGSSNINDFVLNNKAV